MKNSWMRFNSAFFLGFALALSNSLVFGQEPLRPLTAPQFELIRSDLPMRQEIARLILEEIRNRELIGNEHSFEARPAYLDPYGQLHVRYDQFYRGVRVIDGMAIIHIGSDGEVLESTRAFRRDINLDTNPLVLQEQAQAIASAHPEMGNLLPTAIRNELVFYPVMGERIGPVLSEPGQKLNAEDLERYADYYILAWYVSLEAYSTDEGFISRDFIVNASDGTIFKSWNSLKTADAIGVGNSQYSGEVTLNTNSVDDDFELVDNTRPTQPHPVCGSTGNRTYDLENTDSSDSCPATIYTDADNIWGDGQSYNGGLTMDDNGQTASVDAAYGIQTTWDYFKNVHNWNGIDNLGSAINSRVHMGTDYQNAFWSDSCACVTYGDGGSYLDVLTALEIVGHEVTHGFMSNTADLIYTDEPGGLNEANSDIFGTMVEFYEAGGGSGSIVPDTGGDWTSGEDIMKFVPALRYMYKPSKDGISFDEWEEGMGISNVHYTSGPMNRAFYFISQGASDIVSNDSYTPRLPSGMTGIGNDKAARIWFRAVTTYLTRFSRYWDARGACIRAARDLYGSGSEEVAAVKNAFAGINVGAVAGSDDIDPIIDLSGPDAISGIMSFTANASDDVGVTQVDYYMDNLWWSTIDTSPFDLILDSTQIANGGHKLRARVRDLDGNIGYTEEPLDFSSSSEQYQLILNPGFESGTFEWSHSGTIRYEDFPSNANSGNYFCEFLGRGLPNSDLLYQRVELPDEAESLNLYFWLKVETEETTTEVQDQLEVKIYHYGIDTVKTFSNLDSPSYTLQIVDLLPYKGQTIIVMFDAEEYESLATTFFIDDVTINASQTLLEPEFTSHPADKTVTVGQSATFSATATGAPTYQWRKNGEDIIGATSSSYTTLTTTLADNNTSFSVTVTNSMGSETSDTATLTVNIRSRDINDDGVVDIMDLALLASAWDATSSSSNWMEACDLDGLGATEGIGESQLDFWLDGWSGATESFGESQFYLRR